MRGQYGKILTEDGVLPELARALRNLRSIFSRIARDKRLVYGLLPVCYCLSKLVHVLGTNLFAFISFLIYPCNFSCVCALCFFRIPVEENENSTPETKKHSIIFEKCKYENIWNFFYKRQKKHEIYFNDVLQVNNKKFWLLFFNKNSSALVTSWRRRIINIDVKRTVANMSAKKCWREWCIPVRQ